MSDIFVIVGPSGVGKGTVLRELLEREPRCWLSVSATTRPPRPGEADGADYFFVTPEGFDDLVRQGGMLEWALVHGANRYGTPKEPVLRALDEGRVPILEVDLDGARQIRRSLPEAEQIFMAPPSWQELERRLAERGTESEEERERRVDTARRELAAVGEFDAVVVNDSVSRATDELLHIMGLAG